MSPLLEVKNLKKYFPVTSGFFKRVIGYYKAVDGVDIRINAGETFGLVGESGCGKTTIGKSILRLIEPTSGEITLDGKDIRAMESKELRLERKNIQISLKNYQIMELLAELGWDGGLVNKECSNNCYSDTVSLIESTKEGNSTEVSREYKFVASLEEGLIKRKLFVFLENNSNNVYSFYMRVLSPSESGFSPVEIVTNESEMSKSLEVRGVRSFKEAGIFEEILAKKTKALLFSWESATKLSYKEGGEYKLLVRKQAGMEGYPLEVEIMFPENLTFTSTPPLALTNGSNFVYNTELSRDFVSRIFWKEK